MHAVSTQLLIRLLTDQLVMKSSLEDSRNLISQFEVCTDFVPPDLVGHIGIVIVLSNRQNQCNGVPGRYIFVHPYRYRIVVSISYGISSRHRCNSVFRQIEIIISGRELEKGNDRCFIGVANSSDADHVGDVLKLEALTKVVSPHELVPGDLPRINLVAPLEDKGEVLVFAVQVNQVGASNSRAIDDGGHGSEILADVSAGALANFTGLTYEPSGCTNVLEAGFHPCIR